MKIKIYLHIGIGKTGTSSIQTMLAESRPQLKEHGYLYPVTGIVDDAHHLLAIFKFPSMTQGTRMLYDNLLKEIESEGASIILISSEQFCYTTEEYIESLRDILTEFCVKIIFYVRNQIQLIPSGYLQRIKQGTDYVGSIEQFFELDKVAFEFQRRIAPWVTFFGHESIIVRVYDQPQVRENVCSDFLHAAGIELTGIDNVERKNLSLPPEFAGLVRDFDDITDNQEARCAFVDELMRLSAYIKPSPAGSLLSPELRDKITEYYREKNQIFADQFLSDAQRRDFLLPD